MGPWGVKWVSVHFMGDNTTKTNSLLRIMTLYAAVPVVLTFPNLLDQCHLSRL